MNSNMYIPFTYHICWSKENLHYYGSRYALGCNPQDLWTKYFTSSKMVKKLREQYGEPDIIEIRKTFETREQTCLWESKVLKRLGAIKRTDWLNEACWPAFDNRNKKRSDETKKKISKALMGMPKPKSQEHRDKISKALKGHSAWNKGVPCSEETKKKISNALKGNKHALKKGN